MIKSILLEPKTGFVFGIKIFISFFNIFTSYNCINNFNKSFNFIFATIFQKK